MSTAHQNTRQVPRPIASSAPPTSTPTSTPWLGSRKWGVSTSPAETTEHARIQAISHKIFAKEDDFYVIDIYDRTEDRRVVPHRVRGGLDDAAGVLCSALDAGARARIISISGARTVWPLKISYETACRMWDHYDLEPEFRDIICTFGTAPNAGRGGATNGFVKTYDEDRDEGELESTACAYAVQYFEDTERATWSQRQTGVYHRHYPHGIGEMMDQGEASKPFDLYILLNSSGKSHFAEEFRHLMNVGDEASMRLYRSLLADPFGLHERLLRTCMADWTWYQRFAGSAFQKTTDMLFATDHPKDKPRILDFEPFRELRQSRDDLLAAVAYCHGTSDVVDLLRNVRRRLLPLPNKPNDSKNGNESHPHYQDYQNDDWYDTTEKQIEGHWHGLGALLSRVENALGLLEYSLDLKTSYVSSEMNRNMNALAEKSADDGAAIRIITILTLLYLPGSFVSSIFGMNFFDNSFSDQPDGEHRMGIAQNFWIYVVLWVPLTLLTAAIYWFVNRRRKQERLAAVARAGDAAAAPPTTSSSPSSPTRSATAAAVRHGTIEMQRVPRSTALSGQRFFRARPTGYGLWTRPSTGKLPI